MLLRENFRAVERQEPVAVLTRGWNEMTVEAAEYASQQQGDG